MIAAGALRCQPRRTGNPGGRREFARRPVDNVRLAENGSSGDASGRQDARKAAAVAVGMTLAVTQVGRMGRMTSTQNVWLVAWRQLEWTWLEWTTGARRGID